MTTQLKAQDDPHTQTKPLAIWLFFVATMVFVMVIVGAITRLTESGLSMVEWRPLMGALPPMNEAEWHRVYALYKASPEFIKENSWMSLHDFKSIFFWEWFHRLLGRLIGVAYALPMLYFWLRGRIPAGYKPKFLAMLALGAAQGFMGWYMVKSGLIDIPDVSHFRLAAHLGLALLIFSGLIWLGLGLIAQKTTRPNKALFTHGIVTLAALAITITWGAFTAGLDAGLIYNTHFPMMAQDQWLPDTAHILHEHSAVQFTHRWLAISTLLTTLSWWVHSLKIGHALKSLNLLALMICAQAGLGIATLLSGVHIHIAVTHQAGALISLLLVLITIFQLRPRNA